MQTHKAIHPMDDLKQELSKILNVIPPGTRITYIDYPIHSNGGDLLIMKGTEHFFRTHRIEVVSRYSVNNFPDDLEIPEDIVIVLHGGGNFGDLYRAHQQLREYVIGKYTHNRIVILPQTIYYQDPGAILDTAHVFSRHRDVHLFVRDKESFETAKQHFAGCHVYLSPDMAHQLWPLSTKRTSSKRTLYFLRTDVESKETPQMDTHEISKDWNTLYTKLDYKVIGWIRRLAVSRVHPGWVWRIWKLYSDYLIHKAVREFGSYQEIRTSRLHGHILACLLNKPNKLLDNSYGKNSRYHSLWTGRMAGSISSREKNAIGNFMRQDEAAMNE